MFRIIRTKELLEQEDYITMLENGINELKGEVASLKSRLGDPTEVIKFLTRDDFTFFDYTELDPEKRTNYAQQARIILDSDAFKNEVSSLLSNWQEWSAKQSKDFDGVVAMRHQMSGIQLLIERLEEIIEPKEKKPTRKDPYAAL